MGIMMENLSEADRHWLRRFAAAAATTDRFQGNSDHVPLLIAGLFGEAGSILAELKKAQRERDAYPAYRRRMLEELGDFLWYFARLVTVCDTGLLDELADYPGKPPDTDEHLQLPLFLRFGAAVGAVLGASNAGSELREPLLEVWTLLMRIAKEAKLRLADAAVHNQDKTHSRWPASRTHAPLFDTRFDEEEQLPRTLDVEFRERSRDERKVVILRCNGINFGDRLTDNILDPDGYRYHDIFHFAYATHLGWSPVVRALLRCKRRSSPRMDEAQDGARAIIVEEAVSAVVFSRAKQLAYFEGRDHVDYDLLKSIQEFVRGFEVDTIALWQWESAILDGYRVFRLLRANRGGRVTLDLSERRLHYLAPMT
jgi:hypothetical protein